MKKLKQIVEGRYYIHRSSKHFHTGYTLYLKAQKCQRCKVVYYRSLCASQGIGLYTLDGERYACGSSEFAQECIRISKVRLLIEKLL